MAKKTTPKRTTKEYKNFVNLFAVLAAATARLETLNSENKEAYLELVDERKDEAAELQGKIKDCEIAIKSIAEQHPEWFEGKKSLKTPYGSVNFRSSTSLEVPNEEASIILIEQKCDEEEKEKYLRKETTLNREALELLTDKELSQFRIKRVRSENCSIKPVKVDLGTAGQSSTTTTENGGEEAA